MSVTATTSVQGPSITIDISTNIPTEIKKMGIKRAFPKNSILFINADECGINLLSASPAAKAPIIGSIPPSSTKKPDTNTTKSTKMKLVYFSESALLKNHFAIRGTKMKVITEKTVRDKTRRIKKLNSSPPFVFDKINANKINTAVSVRIVPPTVIATA